MKMTSKNWLAAVGVVLAGTALATEFKKTGFESPTYPISDPGPALNGRDFWVASPSVEVTTAKKKTGDQAVVIPAKTDIYTTPAVTEGTRFVWNDFWTIPRLYVSTAPSFDPDPTASAQFFLKPISVGSTVGKWAVINGNGSGGGTAQYYDKDTAGTSIAYTEDGSTWVQVSVLLDYDAHTWSFFIDGVLVAKDLGFIKNTNARTDFKFAMANGNGDGSANAWLDDVAIASTVTDLGLPPGGTVGSAAIVLDGTSLQVQNVGNNRTFTIYGGRTLMTLSTSTTGPVGEGDTSLSGPEADADKYLYKVVEDGQADRYYIRLSQPRVAGRTYLVTSPVVYSDAERRLDGLLGTHLAQGLNSGNTSGLLADSIQFLGGSPREMQTRYYIAGRWCYTTAGNDPATDAIDAGTPVMLIRGSLPASPAVFFGPVTTDATPEVPLTPGGWSMVGWASANDAPSDWSFLPADHASAILANCDVFFRLDATTGQYVPVVHRPNGWTTGFTIPRTGNNLPSVLNTGEGLLYYRAPGVGGYWPRR